MSGAMAQAALQTALGAHYSLDRELGRGGMAAVYLARDLRHRRHVAVKVLHPELSAVIGPERFLKEVEVTASLQHPHILPLFDSGSAGGLLYYVMPFVEGETLRKRLERERQLPVAESVRIATEVASALDYAHRHGIVHRDIKPENILLQDGAALVADFGIALAVQQAGGERMTQTGLSLGTPQYMAPEQAAGDRGVDHRADVYALGAVLYEMLAGEAPFAGPSAQAVVAKIMTEEPKALTRVRRSVPANVDAAVRTALEKLPADRFPSAAAFGAALAVTSTATAPAPARDIADTRPLPRRTIAMMTGAALAAVALAWMMGRASVRRLDAPRPVRFTIEHDSTVRRMHVPAISPDGRTIVYVAEGDDGARLYVRRLDDVASRPLPGTENAQGPFFSPDGAWIAFYSNGALRKLRVDGGGAPVAIAPLPPPASFFGGSWGSDDAIHFATFPGGIYRVSADGAGAPSRVAVEDSSAYLSSPRSLPGGRALLLTVLTENATGRAAVLDLETGRLRQFGPGFGASFAAGHIVYASRTGELFRQPFDVEQTTPTGAAEQIASGLDVVLGGAAFGFDVAAAGSLVYLVGSRSLGTENRSLTLVDRAGQVRRVIPGRVPWEPRFSPDGRRIAYGAYAPGRDSSDVWLTELENGRTQRLTSDVQDNNDPVWSPDGRLIAYDRNAPGGKDVMVQPSDGGTARLVVARPGTQWPTDWLRDGSAVLFTERDPGGQLDIWLQPIDGGAARPVIATPAQELGGRISPDGRWIAYQSNETGRYEVYVRSFPGTGRATLVSANGGVNPVWARDGRSLYYWQLDQLFAARVEAGGPGAPLVVHPGTPLFRAPFVENTLQNYDVSPDAKHFAVVLGEARPSRVVVALDALRSGVSESSGRP